MMHIGKVSRMLADWFEPGCRCTITITRVLANLQVRVAGGRIHDFQIWEDGKIDWFDARVGSYVVVDLADPDLRKKMTELLTGRAVCLEEWKRTHSS